MTQRQVLRRSCAGLLGSVLAGFLSVGWGAGCARAPEPPRDDGGVAPSLLIDSSPWIQKTHAWSWNFFGIDPATLPTPEETGFQRGRIDDSTPGPLLFEFDASSHDWARPSVNEHGLWVDGAGELWRFTRANLASPRVVRHLGHVKPDVLGRMRANAGEVGTEPLVFGGEVCKDCAGPQISLFRSKNGHPERVTVGLASPKVEVDPSAGGQALLRWMLALWRDLAAVPE